MAAAGLLACSVEDRPIDDGSMRSGESEPEPELGQWQQGPEMELTEVAVALVSSECGCERGEDQAIVVDALRAEGVRVLVTLPGGVWLTAPVSAELPAELEAAGQIVQLVSEVDALAQLAEQAAQEAEAGGEEPGGEADEVAFLDGGLSHARRRATSLATALDVVSKAGDPPEEEPSLEQPEPAEVPHALLPAEMHLFEPSFDEAEGEQLPEELGGPADAAKAGTPARDRGKFLRGDVAVLVFFPESTGVGNEDWTVAEYQNERFAYISWLTRLARVAPPDAQLVFQYFDIAPQSPFSQIGEEPTEGVNEWVWAHQYLNNIGIAGGGGGLFGLFNRIQTIDAMVMNAIGVDHVAVGFSVKDDEPTLSQFNGLPWRDAWPHAFFNSYLVTNSRFGGVTFIHELMHVFHAADEYDGGNFITPCRDWSTLGHKRAIEAGGTKSNGNHENCNHHSDDQSCLMNGGPDWAPLPFWRPLMCWYTRAQVGWHDSAALAVQARYPVSMGTPSPSPRVLIEGQHTWDVEDFRYVFDENNQYGARRCATGSLTGSDVYSLEAGLTSSCAADRTYGGTMVGGPADVEWPAGPTYFAGGGLPAQSFDEGRVNFRPLEYHHYRCGDGICDNTEDHVSCPADCTCGNGLCDPGENPWTCAVDCDQCGNGVCDPPWESPQSCPVDCCMNPPCIQ